MENLIGSVAALLTTTCFIPQAVKVVRTKRTEDLSLWTYVLFSVGVSFWLAYGILLNSLPMIGANAITLPLALTILYTKIRHG